ncbi:MAG: hypothetical protein ACK52I_07660 [Pseudomonadota bacterium]
MEIKLIKHPQERRTLTEGRQAGLSTTLLRVNSHVIAEKEEMELEEVCPMSACKDYASDAFYSELNNVTLDGIYGYTHKLQSNVVDKNQPYLHLGLSYVSIKKEVEDHLTTTMTGKLNEIQNYINHYEKLFGLENFTTIYEIHSNYFCMKAPMFWFPNQIGYGFYVFLVRSFFEEEKNVAYFLGEIVNFNQEKYLTSINELYDLFVKDYDSFSGNKRAQISVIHDRNFKHYFAQQYQTYDKMKQFNDFNHASFYKKHKEDSQLILT